ncbi:hypothetical protein ACGFY8_05280 [Streptomyces sp. NPDC048232]|uniref:hypothetical protein n=1 Tax=Streptomyces sp. NPDC048232 TaxID=3365520 RepID=UPI0037161323
MEQRRGSSSQPLEGAGFDPAFIPGLTAPVSGEPADVRRDKADADADADAETGVEADGVADAVPPARESAEDSAETDEEEAAAPVDGPVFEAADRRARIVADHKGVRLSLDDQSCEFRWDEVGAVETETGRFGKRFTVTVHTPDRRWYPIEIEATSRSRFAEWESALDEVLDAYFEDDEAQAEPEPESKAEPESVSETESEPEATADAEPDAKASLAKSDAVADDKSDSKSDTKSGGKPAADAEE